MSKYKPCADPANSSFREVPGDPASPGSVAIQFLPCGITSYHPKDVEFRYCALCHRFIEKEAP